MRLRLRAYGSRDSLRSSEKNIAASQQHDHDEPTTSKLPTLLELPDLDLGPGFEVPSKAERVLGNTNRKSLGATTHDSSSSISRADKDADSAPASEQKTLGKLWATHVHSSQDTMPVANGGLKAWPNVHNVSMQDLLAAGMERSRMSAVPPTADSRQHGSHRQAADPYGRSHYDPSRQPLIMPQQTSASAMRDMGLRKGSTRAPASQSDTDLSRRPLKSALRQPSPERERKSSTSDGYRTQAKKEIGRRPRLDFGHFLPRQNSANKIAQLTGFTPSPSSNTERSGSFPFERSHQQLRPTMSNKSQPSAPTSAHSDTKVRPKVFEAGVYDSAKVNVRRPPKGIQNWFDGFDISSDEEEHEQELIELPASEPVPSSYSAHRGVNGPGQQGDGRQPHRGLSSKTSANTLPQSVEPTRRPSRSRRNLSDDLVDENILAIEKARQRMQARQMAQTTPKASQKSRESSTPSGYSGMNRSFGGESRLAHSHLADESVLALSDSSEDEGPGAAGDRLADYAGTDYEAGVGDASPVDLRRPPIPPHELEKKHSFARETYMTTQTSGSIPITFNIEDAPRIPTNNKRDTQDSTARHTEAALRRLIGRELSLKQSRRTSRAQSNVPSRESAGGETVDSYPSDASHMMAVTEEEMALLEMMRNKRAAMQKDSYSEGYNTALRREEEQLILRRRSAQKTALESLREKDERGSSPRTPSSQYTGDRSRDYGMSTLHRQNVDSDLKIDRYFAAETALENVFPSPPSHSREQSEQGSIAPLEELLLPRTYTPQPSHQKSTASPLLPSPSTMGTIEDQDLEEAAKLEADLSRFLASGGRADSVAFPLPPKSSAKDHRRKSQRANGAMCPVLPSTEEEEESVPPIPSRNASRLNTSHSNTPSPRPEERKPSRERADSTVLNPSALTVTAGVAQPTNDETPAPRAKRGHYTSLLSPYFEAFDEVAFPPSLATHAVSQQAQNQARADSPSVSTSRASPMTPTFAPSGISPAEKHTQVDVADSDSISPRAYASSDGSSLKYRVPEPHMQPAALTQRKKKTPPPHIETYQPTGGYDHERGRMGSVSSLTSAAEDVLAAWADLGGGNDGFVGKRHRTRAR